MSRFFSQMGKHKMTVILEEAEQLQGNRYGENDDSEVADVAVGTVHPLGWISCVVAPGIGKPAGHPNNPQDRC